MSNADQSEVVIKLVDLLGSLQDLQLLLILMDDPEHWWDARAIAEESGNSSSSSGQALDRLAAKNLLDIRVTDDIRFRYRPGTPELERAGAALAEAYRRNPIAILKYVTGRSRSAAHFANAFRIRNDDDR